MNAGSGGSVVATKQRTHDGDTTQVQVVNIAGVAGTEDSYTHTDIAAGGGVEAAALRVTIASDSTGVLSVDDNGSTLSVDDGAGSLTVDNAALSVTGGGVEASALRVTIANDSTGVVSVDDNGGSITVDGTVGVSGTVTVGAHDVTNAGTFAVQVDGAALTSLQLIDNLVLAEDAAHQTGDPGIQVLGVRQNSQADFGADGDYVPLSIDDNGGVRVSIVAGAGSGGTSATDDAAFSVASGSGTPIMGLADETTPDSVDEGDVGVVRMTLARGLHVNLRDDAGDSVMDGTNNAVRVNVVTGGGSGGTSTADDADFTATSTLGTIVQGVYESTPSSVTDGDVGAIGITQTRAVKVAIDSGGIAGRAEDSAHSTGQEGVVCLAVRRDTAAVGSDTDGDYSTFNVDANGRLHVNVGNTVTVGSHAVTNAGTFAVQVDGAALTALQLIDNPIVADDAAFTVGTTSVNVAGYIADEASTDSVDEGDAGAARMTLDRKQVVTPYPHTAGGLSIFRSLDLDETEEDVKTSAGQVYGMWVTNTATSTRFVKFYNATAANVTVGTTTPVITIGIPGNTSDDVSGNFGPGGMGIAFGTAISVAATTGAADNDTGAPGANEVIVNIFYA